MKVTVIVPVFNRPDTLSSAIRSVLLQKTDATLDILIVDDGSTDQTADVIKELVQANPTVRTVRRTNGGVTQARNTGLAHIAANADIVTFLDSDDVMAPDRFATDLPLMTADPEIEITYGNLIATEAIDPMSLKPPLKAIQREITAVHLSCALFRRSLILRIGLFDDHLKQSEDTDYLLRIFESGTRFVQTQTVCLYYLRHDGSMTKDTSEAQKYFALALLKSLRRRKADPSLRLHKPDFAIQLPRELC